MFILTTTWSLIEGDGGRIEAFLEDVVWLGRLVIMGRQ